MDLTEFRTAYLVEVEELLGAANGHLLAIEASLRAGEHNLRSVRELFRAVHTIKGLSAMVGVEPVVVIAHRMEAALRTADRSGRRLTLPAVDLMLTGMREIEQRVRAVAERREPAEVSLQLLDRLAELELPAAAPARVAALGDALEPALLAKIGPAEREQILQAVARGRRAVRIEFAPSRELADAGVNITSVREGLGVVAEIVKVVPRSVPVTPATPGGLSFTLIVVTDTTDEAMVSAARLDPGNLETIAVDVAPAPGAGLMLEPDEDEEEEAAATPRHGFVRVDVSRLDAAMEGLSALIVTRFRLARALQGLADQGANVRELREIVQENARQLRDLRAAILRVRMVPLVEVLDRVPLLVRGLSRSTGRQVQLEIDVGTAEVDKTVAERIFPAIIHLVRNAMDHAIEAPEQRRRAGKPEQGRLRLSCAERSNTQLELEVQDDGAGIDAAAVARRAGRALPQSDAELLDLLCMPGLSTRDQATTTSGRGMGMDIVRRTIVEQLGGELLLETRPGVGTRFVLRVPLTISIVDAFTFETAGERFCVPVSTIEEILDVDHARLVKTPGAGGERSAQLGMLERRGEALPFIALARVLQRTPGPGLKAFVVRRNGEPMAFAVDRLLGQQEVVVRPLVDPLVRVAGVTGATDLGDGRPTLVLDLYALGGRAAAEPRPLP